MANTIRYVNAGSAGGDGTTQELSGGTAAYASLQAALEAERTDLTAANTLEIICEGSTADTTLVYPSSGWTTDATHYVYIHPGTSDQHSGVWSDSIYRLTNKLSNAQINHLHIQGLQIKWGGTGSGGSVVSLSGAGAGWHKFERNLVVNNHQSVGNPGPSGLSMVRSTQDYYAWNNIIYVASTATFTTIGDGILCGTSADPVFVANNTAYGFTNNFNAVSGTWTVRNNLAFGHITADYSGTFGTSENNLSEDATAPTGGTEVISASVTFSGTDDFRVTAGDSIDAGVTVSDDPPAFTDDITGTARAGTWDIGAFEFVTAVSTTEAAGLGSVAATLRKLGGSTSRGGQHDMELRPYGVATRVDFPLISAGSADFLAGATLAAGDFQIASGTMSGALGAFGNTTTTTPTDEGSYYSQPLTAAEMQAARIVLRCVDASGEEWDDRSTTILTIGHPLAGIPQMGIPFADQGAVAGAGSSSTTVLASSAPATNDILNGSLIYIIAGTGAGQMRYIVDYVEATDTVTVDPAWTTTPTLAGSSIYAIVPAPPSPTLASYAAKVDMIAISGDSIAADNAEAFFDDSGFNANSSSVGLVQNVSSVESMSATMKAEVNAEMVDVLGTDTMAEMTQGIPPATPTFKQAVMYLYMRLRNKLTVTSSEHAIYNNVGTKIAKKTVSDDGSTYTEAEMVSGA